VGKCVVDVHLYDGVGKMIDVVGLWHCRSDSSG